MLTNKEVHSWRVFSIERPTRRDFELWRQALRDVTSAQYSLESPLGRYLTFPHNSDDWFATTNESKLYRRKEENIFEVYSKLPNSKTPRRPCYKLAESGQTRRDVNESVLKIATVLPSARDNTVSLHSTATPPQAPRVDYQSVPDLLNSIQV